MMEITTNMQVPIPPTAAASHSSGAADDKKHPVSGAEAQHSFGQIFKSALDNVNMYQKESQEMTQKLLTGEVDNLHDVIISSEKAGIGLQATVEVRDKVMEAYDKVMRMTL